MMPRYYVFDDKNEAPKHEFVSVESMMVFLHERTETEGEFHTNFSSIKVKYNTHDGNVFLVSAENRKWLVNFFSPDAFQYLIQPVADAISLLAKWHLLLHLHDLGDEGITHVIKHNHTDKETGALVHLNSKIVHHTLYQLRDYDLSRFSQFIKTASLLRPKHTEVNLLQQEVCAALKRYRVENIKAKKDVDSIIQSISTKLNHRQTLS